MKVYSQSTTAYSGAATKFVDQKKTIFSGTADQIAVNEIILLQLRAAHSFRNNGYAKTAANKYVTNLGSLQVNWVDNETKKQLPELQAAWEEFSKNPMLDGYGDLKTWQSLCNYSRFLNGAAFTRKHIRRTNAKIPLKLEVINPLLHDVSYFRDNHIKFGIEFKDTKPENYFFRLNLFEDFEPISSQSNDIVKIPASEIIHSFIRTQPGQWIGIPELSSVLLSLYRLDDLVDVTVSKQILSQALTIIVTGSNPTNQLPVGGIRRIDTASGVELEKGETSENEQVELRTEGTNILYPKRGESVSMFQGADIGENLLGLLESELRKLANSVDVPYHQLTGDLSGINFSSLRALNVELRKRLEFIHHFYTIPLELQPLTDEFKQLAKLYIKNIDNAVPLFQLPLFRGVDDLKDAQADRLEMQTGFGLLREKLAERHITFEQLKEDLRMRKELKDEFDFDAFTLKAENKTQEKKIKVDKKSLDKR